MNTTTTNTTITTCWTPSLRRYAPQDAATLASPTDAPVVAEDYPALAAALLDHRRASSDRQDAVYGVLAAAQVPQHRVEPRSGQLRAVRLPATDLPGGGNLYQLLACLDLTGWDGVVAAGDLAPCEVPEPGNVPLGLVWATRAGADGVAVHQEDARRSGTTVHPNTVVGSNTDFTRAAIGRRFRTPLPYTLVYSMVTECVSDPDGEVAQVILDPTIDDKAVIEALGLTAGVSPELVDQVCPEVATRASEVVPSIQSTSDDLVVTPDLINWMGGGFFRLGLTADLETGFLVRAVYALAVAANPNDPRGEQVRRTLAALTRDHGHRVVDRNNLFNLLCAIVLNPKTIHPLLQGTRRDTYPPRLRFGQALVALLEACDPNPGMPLLARRVAALHAATEGTRG